MRRKTVNLYYLSVMNEQFTAMFTDAAYDLATATEYHREVMSLADTVYDAWVNGNMLDGFGHVFH